MVLFVELMMQRWAIWYK